MKEYLIETGVDPSNFEISSEDIKDILLLRKSFTQKVKSEVVQRDLNEEDDLKEAKVEIPRSTLFKPEDYEIGGHKICGVEPGSFITDDCITCDGHGEITCPKCTGTTEISCSSCEGTGSKTVEVTNHRQEERSCGICKGAGTNTGACRACSGKGAVTKMNVCTTCQGRGGMQSPTGFQACGSCRGSRKINQSLNCSLCMGSGRTTSPCAPCGGKGRGIMAVPFKERVVKKCNSCGGRGRFNCGICKGQGNTTCHTCAGNRRTIQYTYNTFTISVKPQYELVMRQIPLDSLEAIALAPRKDLISLYDGEKDKLKAKLIQHKLKLSKKIACRVKGTIHTLEDKLTGSYYYVYEANGKFYTSKQLPKSSVESYAKHYISKITRFLKGRLGRVWRKVENSLTGKNEY